MSDTNSPYVIIDTLTPAPGTVVSNTVYVEAKTRTLKAPIAKIEYYRDGKLIGIVYYNTNFTPTNVTIKPVKRK